jgi:hypothetical protein
MEDLLSIHFKKSNLETKFFMKFTSDGFMDRFTSFEVTSRKHPWSIGLVSSEEDLPFRIKDECTDNNRVGWHREKFSK